MTPLICVACGRRRFGQDLRSSETTVPERSCVALAIVRRSRATGPKGDRRRGRIGVIACVALRQSGAGPADAWSVVKGLVRRRMAGRRKR